MHNSLYFIFHWNDWKLNLYSIGIDADDNLYEALAEFGLSNLYDVMKNNSISVKNIWYVGEERLKEWNVPINDILDYKRAKTQYGGKFDQTIDVNLT